LAETSGMSDFEHTMPSLYRDLLLRYQLKWLKVGSEKTMKEKGGEEDGE